MRSRSVWILVFCLMAARLFSAVISTIEQLDEAALFSFSLQSDNKGFDHTHATVTTDERTRLGGERSARMESWIKANDEFCIGVGDHVFSNRDRWIHQMEDDPFFHNHYYPAIGDHDNKTTYTYGAQGVEDQWGRGWTIFKALNNFFSRPDVQFRPKQSTKINNNGKLVDDQLCDYYAVREHSGFKIHMIVTHFGDASVFAHRTKEWMMQKIRQLGAVKTDRDIIIVLAHSSGNFFRDVVHAKSVEDGYSAMSTAEMDTLMMTADLICDASDHVFRRHHERDGMYDGTEALWINTGALDTGACCGYVNIHVFDNPPRFTMQYIDVETKSTRTLHVGNSLKIDSSSPYLPYRYPYMKQVNGPTTKIDWKNFPLNTVALTNGATFVSQVVPSSMVAGTTSNVTVRMKNSGTKAWSGEYYLGSQNPVDNTTWGTKRVKLPSGVTVAAGQEYSFSFAITAPATVGTNTFQWKMIDASTSSWFGGLTANKAIAITAPPPVNQAPYFTSASFAMANATEGSAYSQSISSKAVDPESGTKTFSKVAGPAWLSVSSTGALTGTPGAVDGGNNSFSVKVTDNGGLSDTATMTINVTRTTVTVPAFVNQSLIYCMENKPAGLVLGPITSNYSSTVASGNVISQTPAPGTLVPIGSSVALSVSKGQSNQPPYFTSNPFSIADATAGTAYSQSISSKAIDPEGGTKTFSKVSGPAWLYILSGGTATGTPDTTNIGANTFSVRVTDNGGLSVTATMTLDVIPATTTVPWVTNLTEAAAGTAITNAGLIVSGVNPEYHATIAAGKIFSQTPGGNTTVTRGSSVALAVSLGPQPSALPPVGSIITLKAVNGKYVSANNTTSYTLIANQTSISNYERFKVVNATNGVGLQCMGNNLFVSIAVPNGSKPMKADRPSMGSYERFKLIQSGTDIAIQSTLSTNYVSAIDYGASPLQAVQTRIGSYEKFIWKVE